MVRNYGTNGFAMFTGTADECKPVLLEVTAGQAPHDASMQPHDGHNYFDLRYSEPVNVGTSTVLNSGADTLNNRSTNVLTLSPGGWDIEERSTGVVTLDSFFRYNGTISAGSHDGNPANSIARQTGYLGGNTHGVRIYINGYATGSAPNFFWEGYTDEIDSPLGDTIRALSDNDVTDASGNPVEPYNDPYEAQEGKTEPTITDSGWDSVTGWDVHEPGFAKYVLDASGDTGSYEILVQDADANNVVDNFDICILDDGVNNPTSGTWVSNVYDGANSTDDDGDGETADRYFPESGAPPGGVHGGMPGGIRDSSLMNPDAFAVQDVSEEPETPSGGFVFSTSVQNNLFHDLSNSIGVQDDSYFSLSFSEADLTLDVISELHMSYDKTTGYLTDYAGNLLESVTKIKCIERVPPRILVSLIQAGTNRLFIRFSEPVMASGGGSLDESYFDIGGQQPSSIQPVTTIDSGTKEAVFELPDNVQPDDFFEDYIQVTGSDLVVDKLGNPIQPSYRHRLSDIGLGVIEPAWASDGLHEEETYGNDRSTLKTFDGSGRLMDRDITLQVSNLTSSYSNLPVTLYYDVDPDGSLLDQFHEELWLPRGITEYIPKANKKARRIGPESFSPPHANFLIPASDDEIEVGAEVEFLLQLGNLFCARGYENDSEWLAGNDKANTKVQPWSFNIEDVQRQAMGVTIISNVINPASGDKTSVLVEQGEAGYATVQVFNLAGDLVKELYRGPQGSGSYTYHWDGTNTAGDTVARGIYYVRVTAPGIDEMRKVLVVK
jgi:hypothetical protein